MRKSYYQQLLMLILKKILNFLGLRPVRNVVFFAPVEFHLQHLMPVVEVLRHDESVRVFVVKTPSFSETSALDNVVILERDEFEKMYWKIHDVVVTTELDFIPYWFGSGKRIGMFHGAGPKKGYLERMTGKEFDYIFSPGPFVHDVELAILGRLKEEKTKVIPVGLPSIDFLVSSLNNIPEKKPKEKPTVLYAPSWHWDPNMVSMDEEILQSLSLLEKVHVIIRPHPNLLIPSRNDNVDWTRIIKKYENVDFVLSRSEPINDLLIQSDIIVGDISSVMYEFLVFDKPGVLYVKDKILEASVYPEAIKPLIEAYERIDHAGELNNSLSTLLSGSDTRQGSRRALKESTFYNIGFSASIAAKEISKISRI
jgi:CDP-Glycerol:Poly(glycerophosphate) glycerophosphotransferase